MCIVPNDSSSVDTGKLSQFLGVETCMDCTTVSSLVYLAMHGMNTCSAFWFHDCNTNLPYQSY